MSRKRSLSRESFLNKWLVKKYQKHLQKKLWNCFQEIDNYNKYACIYIYIHIILTHSKTILENAVEIGPQPVALDFKKLSQYSSRSK